MKWEGRKILLLVDNAKSHIFKQANYPNVCVEFLDLNMTLHIQPLDVGIIRAFKAHYWQLYIWVVLNNLDNNEGNILKSISYVGCDLL
jgi:hypothetical protein